MRRRRPIRWNKPFLIAVLLFVLIIAAYIAVGTAWKLSLVRHPIAEHDIKLALLALCLDATLAVWFFAVGASIGSFLNVVAYRLPIGKSLNGHSACPYCCVPIAAADNIPVFAWLRLRGRCRSCHLPISVQYPLIELMVGLAFLSVYFTEFAIAGSNLPGGPPRPNGIGLVWMSVTRVLSLRVLEWAWAISGLVAVALMIARQSRPPLMLFFWVLLVPLAIHIYEPATQIVSWRYVSNMPRIELGASYSQVEGLITQGLGLVAGLCLAAVLRPLLGPLTSARGWYGALAVIGFVLGWQAIAPATCCILIATIVGYHMLGGALAVWVLPRSLLDPSVWAWLGALIFRAAWRGIDQGLRQQALGAALELFIALAILIGACLAWYIGHLNRRCVIATVSEVMEEPAVATMDNATTTQATDG